MEPVTHILTGACLARTGFHKRVAYATAMMAIAAEFPDVDTLWSLRGPVSGFTHHRGITHTFLGIPFEAGILLCAAYAWHHVRRRRWPSTFSNDLAVSRDRRPAGANSLVPVRWGTLYLLLIVALLSHLLLDYTNNYGLRPFFPFNTHWYAASIVFIFDPLIFFLLVMGLSLPALFGLINHEIGVRREDHRARGWARAALACVLLLWSARWFEHGQAIRLAQTQMLRAPAAAETASATGSEAAADGSDAATPQTEINRPWLLPQRSLASPDPLSVFRWYTVTDFGPVKRLGLADTRLGTVVPGKSFVTPPQNRWFAAAQRSSLGQAYLDWSPMPILSEREDAADGASPDAEDPTLLNRACCMGVLFADPRFMGEIPWRSNGGAPPLTGEVLLDSRGRVIQEGIDGRFGR